MSATVTLPGRRFAVERWRDVPRLIPAASWLFGPRALWAIRSSREGKARTAEASWAHAAARWLDLRISVGGLEHVDPEQAYIVAPLHEGFADALALLRLPIPLRFVARDELAGWSVLGRALEVGGHPLVTPESGVAAYRTILRTAPSILDGGESLVVFPQGTILGIETAFSSGAFRLAAATNRPLLPVVLTGSHRVWEHPFSPVVRFGQRIHMEILASVGPREVVAAHRSLEREMKSVALAADPQPRRFVPERDGWWDGYRFTIDPDYSDLAARVAAHRSQSIRQSA